MQYYKISTGKFIQYDETTEQVKIIYKEDIESNISILEIKIASIRKIPDNKKLLEWAKKNYPQKNIENPVVLEKSLLKKREILTAINSIE